MLLLFVFNLENLNQFNTQVRFFFYLKMVDECGVKKIGISGKDKNYICKCLRKLILK